MSSFCEITNVALTISLSSPRRGADEEEGNGEKEIKRSMLSVLKNLGKVGLGFVACKINKQC
ncbi:Ranatuerin-1 [Aquarana catesbeiana]|uniref:Ranatuerin-1 n=1 Tax=Aquarana catesbeiana TaxID=8400 RepID=A0A2G9Q9C7_AQUCT|nr:Ranatuerin-1 [Aquarana catesbeiana]